MADIDTVLERLITDAGFRQRLGEDPAAALSPYDLSTDDLQLLAGSMDSGDAGQRGVEQRTSKSAVIGLLASLTGGGGGSGGGHVDTVGRKGYEHYGRSDGAGSPTGSSDPPLLDGSSKEGASLSQHAPPDETLHKLPGKPKAGEITVTKSAAAPLDDTVRKVPGNIKWSGSRSGDELPPPGAGDHAGADREHYTIKLTNATVKDSAQLAPPGGDAGTENLHTIKLTNATVKDSAQLAPPAGDAGTEDLHTIKLTNSTQQSADQLAPAGSSDGGITDFKVTNQGGMATGPVSARAADDDFLRIEDE